MKKFLRAFVSSVLLILPTSHLNIRSYMAFDRAPIEKRTWGGGGGGGGRERGDTEDGG